MKVIILCSNYEPGGAQRVSLRLETALKQRGIDASCWFFHRKSDNFSKELPNLLIDRKISKVKDVGRVMLQFLKVLNHEKPDALISFLPYANTLGLFIAFLRGVKIRIASHRSESQQELSLNMRVVDFMCAFFGIYTSITAVSESTKSSFSFYPDQCFNKIKVINNGLDYTDADLSKEKCRQYFNLNGNEFIIGTIGRLVSSKNHRLLIEILPFVDKVQLVIVGKGSLKQELIEIAQKLDVSEKLTIIDEVSTIDIPRFLNAIDIFVMPTLYEGLSNALLEALHAGLPIVSSDVAAQREVLIRSSDGLKAGVLVDVSNPKEWINEVNRLKEDEAYREYFHKNALIRSLDFTLDRMADGYISLLKRQS